VANKHFFQRISAPHGAFFSTGMGTTIFSRPPCPEFRQALFHILLVPRKVQRLARVRQTSLAETNAGTDGLKVVIRCIDMTSKIQLLIFKMFLPYNQ